MRSPLRRLVALSLMAAAVPVAAKRAAPHPVPPLERDGVRYVAGHVGTDTVDACTVSAVAGQETRWTVRLFERAVRPELERDVQDVFVRSLEWRGRCILVTSERGDTACVDARSGAASPGPAKDVLVDGAVLRATALEAAVPLFRTLGPEPTDGGAATGGPPVSRATGPWTARASPLLLPTAWPPPGDGRVELAVYAVGNDPRLADAEHQAAPFARVVLDADDGRQARVTPLGTSLRPMGIQGFLPAPAPWTDIDAANLALRRAVRRGGLPTDAETAAIRRGACAFLGRNGLLGASLAELQPAYVAWLACRPARP